MSQDKDDTQNFSDSDEDEKSDNSTSSSARSEETDHFTMIEVSTMNFSNTVISDVSPGSARDITDEDSRRLNSAVEDMRVEDKDTASESSGDITEVDSTKSNSGVGENQAGCKNRCATKRRFPFSNEDSKPDSNFKKRTVSTSPKQKTEGRKSINSTESNLPFMPEVITPEKFEKKCAVAPDEGNEKPQHSPQRPGFYSTQNPTTQSSPKQIDTLATDKTVDIDRETKISDTPTKLGFHPSDGNFESRPDSKKHATSIKPDENAEKGARILTITDLNLPPSHVVFSPEKFEKEFSKISSEDNKASSQLSLQQSKLISQKRTSQSLQKQMDDPSFTFDEHKHLDMHQETKIPSTPTNRRDCSLKEDSEYQPDSEKCITSKPEEKSEEDSRITTTTELNLSPSQVIFSPERFDKELARIPRFQHSSQQPKLFSQSPILQSPQTLMDDSSLTVDSAKQSDAHQGEKISTTPTNRRGLFFDEDLEFYQPASEIISKPNEKVVEDSRITTTTELNLPPLRLIFSPERFEREFTRISREEDYENLQLSSIQSELSSQNTTPLGPQKQTDDPSLVVDSDKQSEAHQEEPISTTPTNQRGLFFDEDSELQPDSEIISKPGKKVVEDPRIKTTTELNLPPSRLIFSPERFEREFSRISHEETKKNSRLSSQHSKLTSQKPASQSPKKQTDDPSLTADSDKQSETHQEEPISTTPANQRGLFFDEDSELQPDSEIISKPGEKVVEDPRIKTTTELNLPPSRLIFSPERFEREFRRISHEDTKKNSRLSSQHSKLTSQKPAQMDDPNLTVDSDKQSDTRQEEKISGTPKKRRRISTDEKSKLPPDSKKNITSTRPVAKVKGYARTTSNELKLPSFREVFSPGRFEKEFTRTAGEKTQHSSQRSNHQSIDQQSQNENLTTNSPLIVRLRNPPINRSTHSEIDPGEGPSHGRRHVVERSFEPPTEVIEIPPEPLSHGREIHLFEIPYLVDQRNQENLFQRALLITTRLSILESFISDMNNQLNAISLQPLSPPIDLTRSHSLAERRASARRYHGETIEMRQLFLSQEPLIEIFRTLGSGMTEILDDIRYDLSMGSHDSSLSYIIWIFKERVENLFTEFCDNCEGDVKSMNEDYIELVKIFLKFSDKVEDLFKSL